MDAEFKTKRKAYTHSLKYSVTVDEQWAHTNGRMAKKKTRHKHQHQQQRNAMIIIARTVASIAMSQR